MTVHKSSDIALGDTSAGLRRVVSAAYDFVKHKDDLPFVALVLFSSINPIPLPQSALNAVTAIWLVYRMAGPNRPRHYNFRLLVPLTAILFIACSFFWATDKSESLWGVGAIIFYTICGVHIVASMDLKRALDGLLLGFKAVIVGSLAAAVVFPSTAFVSAEYQRGAFQGMAYHKNYMGYLLALAAIMFVYRLVTDRTKRVRNVIWLLLCAVLCYATQSQTSILMLVMWTVVMFFILLLLRSRSRARGPLGFGLIGGAVAGGLIVMVNFTQFTESIGRDPTLTGRTEIWSVVLNQIAQRPLFGRGWASVWGSTDAVGNEIRAELGFSISHAHNGYLNVALEIGWVGLALVGLALLIGIFSVLRNMLRLQWPELALALVILLTIASFNFVETRLTLNTGWLLLVIFYAYSSRASGDFRRIKLDAQLSRPTFNSLDNLRNS